MSFIRDYRERRRETKLKLKAAKAKAKEDARHEAKLKDKAYREGVRAAERERKANLKAADKRHKTEMKASKKQRKAQSKLDSKALKRADKIRKAGAKDEAKALKAKHKHQTKMAQKILEQERSRGFTSDKAKSWVSGTRLLLPVALPLAYRAMTWMQNRNHDADARKFGVSGDAVARYHGYGAPLRARVAKLADADRLSWSHDACEELRTRPTSGSAPDDAWMKLKDARSLRPAARTVAQSLAAWRERRAMRTDVPVRQVLPDLAILGISQRGPSTVKELSQARGVDDRHSRGGIAEEILDAVRAAKDMPAPVSPPSSDDLERSLRPAVTLVSAWVAQLARDEHLDPTLLATRSDIVAFLRGDDDARLASGWRNDMVGDGVRRLVGGEAGLTFDPQGRLRLTNVAD